MMKKRRNLFAIFFAALALVAALALFAACNGNEGGGEEPALPKDVTVTFNFGGEGKNVTLTGLPGEAMALPEAADNQNYYFGGWHAKQDFSDDALGADSVFPQKNAVYFAKWYVKYKFEVSVEGFDGVYARDESYDVEGEVAKNVTDSVSVRAEDFDIPTGYKLKNTTFTVQLAGRDNVAEALFERAALRVNYVSGVSGIDSVADDGKYGMSAKGNVFGDREDRRLLGWSASRDGGLEIFEGDTLLYEGSKTLYAVWATAYDDALGGADVVYVAKGISETAILSKAGYGDVEGTYDEATGLLSFGGGERSLLQGKLLEHTFFYFKDAYNRVFNSEVEGDTDTLRLKEGGAATYTNKRGESIDGGYSVDEESGDFVFESEDFTCNFKLYEPYLGIGDITFRMQDEYEGFYAEKQGDGFGYTVIYLDGYGGAFEVWDPNRPYYNPYDDYEEIYFEGEYAVLEQSAGMPQLELDIIRVPSYLIDVAYTVRLDLSVTGALGGVQISGVYLTKDEYEGHYVAWDYEEDPEHQDDQKNKRELVLDGYESASYQGEPGTYSAEVIHWYEFNGEYDDETEQPIYDVHEHKFIRFKGEDGKELLFELEINDYAEYLYYSPISEEQNVFEFENSTELLYDAQGELMLELWHDRAIVWESHAGANRITYYTRLDEGDVSELELGWKHFSGAAQFDYRITSLEDYTVRWRGDANQLVFEEGKLYIDESGEGKYVEDGKTVTVEYTVDGGLVSIYRFTFDGAPTRVFAERDGSVTEITRSLVFNEDRSGGTLIARMIFVDDGRAIVGFRLSDGVSYAYLVDGTYVKDGDVYTFAYGAVEEGYERALEDYLNFEFKAAEGEFVRNDGYEFSVTGDGYTFTADGYGNATLAKDGGETLEGTYEFLNDLTVFAYEGGERFLSITRDGEQYVMKVVGEEAGYYYELSEGRVTSTSSYFFFDGLGHIFYNQYFPEYGTFSLSEGRYRSLESTDKDGYKLYEFWLDSTAMMQGTYTVHVGFENTTDGRTVGTYWIESSTNIGTYVVRLDGEPYGVITTQKGAALWIIGDEITVGTLTRCNVIDDIIYTRLPDGSREIAENYRGKSILFAFGTYGQEDYFEFLFDITDKTEQVDGADCPVIEARLYDYGMYGRYDGELKNERIYLDGHGNMTVYDAAGDVSDQGVVQPKEEGSKIYVFTGSKSNFEFVISIRMGSTSAELNIFEYVVYDEASDNVYVGEDWTALVLDGFGGAELHDKYGEVTTGTYSYVVGNIIKLEYNIVEVAYIALGNGKFEVNDDDFIRIDGVLYYYMGTDHDIVIPDGIHTIAKDAFYGSYITSVDFAQVKRIEDGALSGASLEEIVANEVTYVGEYAFSDMGTSLKRVSLPKAEHIGAYAFYGDTDIDAITLGSITYIGSQAFSISSINGTTLLDMTAVADIAAVDVEDDAFVAVDFEGELLDAPVANLRVLVKDVETVNKLLADAKANALLSQNAVITYGDEATSLEAASTKFGRTFYSAKTGELYILDGKLSKVLDVDACTVQSVGLYAFAKEGDDVILNVYPYENGSYSLTPAKYDEGFLKVGDELLVEIGSNDYKQYAFVDEDGKQLLLSMRVYYDLFAGIAFDAKITYDSRETTNVSVTGAEIMFAEGGAVYSVRIDGKGKCTLFTLGEEKEMTSKAGKFRLTVSLGLDGKIKACSSFFERIAGNYVQREIVISTANEDGSMTLSVQQLYSSIRSDSYTVVYDDASDSLTLYQNVKAYWESSDEDEPVTVRYGVALVWDAETNQAIKCTEFEMDEQSYSVVGFVSQSVGVAEITVDMNGSRITFRVEYVVDGFAIRRVTQI